MPKELLFALISTAIYLVWAIPYWKDLILGKNIPHIFTYSLWWILVGFNVSVLIVHKEYFWLIPSWLMFTSVSFWCYFGIKSFSKISINWFDWLCFWWWLVLVWYWFVSKNILRTVILTLILDFIAFLPTFKKWWLQPWSETAIMYFMSALWQISTIFSLSWFENIENMLFWWYLFVANLIFFFMVTIRRYYLRWWNSIFE